LASAYRGIVEDTSSESVKAINQELKKYYSDLDLLADLDGRVVNKGKLGKYFAAISGNLIGGATGSAIGGLPGMAIGTVVGGEVGGRIQGNILTKTFGRATGNVAPKSEILTAAAARAASPRLALPAPSSKLRSSVGSGPAIKLPSKLPKNQETLDASYSKSLGNRNQQYAPINTTSKTSISKTIPQTPIEKHMAYAKASGYEPYVNTDTLPVVKVGKTPVSKAKRLVKGLPIIKGNTQSGALIAGAAATAIPLAIGKLASYLPGKKIKYTTPPEEKTMTELPKQNEPIQPLIIEGADSRDDISKAVALRETRGEAAAGRDPYKATNTSNSNGTTDWGKYQVNDQLAETYYKRLMGKPWDPQAFLSSPDDQETFFTKMYNHAVKNLNVRSTKTFLTLWHGNGFSNVGAQAIKKLQESKEMQDYLNTK
jgi:hypothetical protein